MRVLVFAIAAVGGSNVPSGLLSGFGMLAGWKASRRGGRYGAVENMNPIIYCIWATALMARRARILEVCSYSRDILV